MKFTAVGDCIMQRHFPGTYEGFPEVQAYIARGDYRFCNLETTVNREGECYGSQFSGGTYMRTDPENLAYLSAYGFNSINCANNHALDFSHTGTLKTIEYLREAGYEAAGIGHNLSRAAAPVYLDTPDGRVALIAMTSVATQPAAMAGEQSRRVAGRPGVNGLRISTHYTVPEEDLAVIRRIAHDTGANARLEVIRAEGYELPLPDNMAEFDSLRFVAGEKAGKVDTLNKADMKRLEDSIHEAKLQADYIFVSIHSHEINARKEDVPEFLKEFCHACIDMGAHAVLGHGPHLLRGIEIYQGKPIFYSLGDFIMQIDNTPFGPEEFYAKYGLHSKETMHTLLDIRSAHFTRGLSTDKRMFETVIPYWEMEDGVLTKLELMPVLLTFDVPRSRYGMPQIKKDDGIIEKLAELSLPFGTTIIVEDGVGVVKI